jgi:hypothetical protein
MTRTVNIVGGTYNIKGKATDVSDTPFEVVRGFKVGARGGYITVNGRVASGFPDRDIRIACDSEDCIVTLSDDAVAESIVAKPEETDEEIMQRIGMRFEMLDNMTRAAKRGAVKALIVSGAPGVGKSFGVESVLGQWDTLATVSDTPPTYEVVKGNMSAIGLYKKLHSFKEPNNILVFDDCDSILFDDVCLNLLKAALDSKQQRRISWNTESYILEKEGVPNTFNFEGSVIFITNLKFDHVRSAKLKAHLEAIESRCHYMDLTIDTAHEKILRIRQVVRNNMLDNYELTSATKEDIIDFVEDNKDKLRELSLRTVIKIADLAVAFPNNWEHYAQTTVMKRS